MLTNKTLVKKVRELWDRQEASVGAFVGDLLDALERADKENDDLMVENLQICGKAGLILDIPRTMEAAKRTEIASSVVQKLLAYDEALRKISKMGAVCSDSCGAALTAINVLDAHKHGEPPAVVPAPLPGLPAAQGICTYCGGPRSQCDPHACREH